MKRVYLLASIMLLMACGLLGVTLIEVWSADTTVPHYPGSAYYTDCAATSPHDQDIGWISEYGVAGGYGDGTFAPGGVVTREQMSTFIMRQSALDITSTIFIIDDMYFDGWYFGAHAYNLGWITAEEYNAFLAFYAWLASFLQYAGGQMGVASEGSSLGPPINAPMLNAMSRALSMSTQMGAQEGRP